MKAAFFLLLAFGGLVATSAPGLTLEQTLDRTLTNNPRIEQAQRAVEEVNGQRLVVRSIALPKVGVAGLAGVQGGQRAGQASTQPFAFAQGLFRQPLFQAAIPASLRRGDLAVLIAAQQLNVVMVEQLHQARLAFYAALYARGLEDSNRAQRQRLEQNVASEQTRYQAGATERDALQSATLLARELDPLIDEAHRAYGAALLQLVAALGTDLGPGAELPVPEGALTFSPASFDLAQETASALEQRADLQLARLLVRAAREDQRIAAAGYYPQLDLTVFGRYIPATNIRQASSGSPQRSDDIVSSEIAPGVSFTWRVLDNGQVKGAVLRQQSVREINRLQLQTLERSVRRELLGLTNNLRALAARRASLEQAVGVAEKNVAVVENSWREGSASQLDYRTAEIGLLTIRRGLLSAAYQQQVALAEWDRATGRYFQFSDQPTNVHSAKP